MAYHLTRLFQIFFTIIIIFGSAQPLQAQSGLLGGLGGDNKKQEDPQDPLGRSTPRQSLSNFVKAAALGNIQNAREYLQISLKMHPEQVDELVREFQTLLDHAYDGNLDSLSDQEIGAINDGLPDNLEDGGSITVQNDKLKIILVRHNDESLGPLWLVSSATLNKIPEFYAKFKKSGLEEKVPFPWLKTKLFQISLWLLISALVLFPVLYGVSWLLIHGVISLFHLIKRIAGREVPLHHPKAAKPFVYQLMFIMHYLALTRMGLPLLYRQYYQRFIYILGLVSLSWLLFILIDSVTNRLEGRLKFFERLSVHSTLLMVAKIFKAFVFAALILTIIRFLGFNISPALATLGLGGLALAFAAQKSLENLFGGISLISDRAFQVGDLCRIGTTLGVVEDIGLRSTRFRTLDRTLLLVPNGALSTDQLENYSQRDKFLFKHTLGLRYQTKLNQLQKLKKLIQEFLEENPKIERENLRTKLIRLGPYSLDLEISAYILAANFDEFLTMQEQLLFRILEFVEEVGAELAYPSQTSYISRDSLVPLMEIQKAADTKDAPTE